MQKISPKFKVLLFFQGGCDGSSIGCVPLCHLCNVFKTSLGGKGFTPLVGVAMLVAADVE